MGDTICSGLFYLCSCCCFGSPTDPGSDGSGYCDCLRRRGSQERPRSTRTGSQARVHGARLPTRLCDGANCRRAASRTRYADGQRSSTRGAHNIVYINARTHRQRENGAEAAAGERDRESEQEGWNL
ncbi:hypothetical protein C8F01DRAFT_1240128, partial [Mycena amicta]